MAMFEDGLVLKEWHQMTVFVFGSGTSGVGNHPAFLVENGHKPQVVL
tara:strand:+ start:315 stop:455 length:141 start_codon:yes stop_codon:yes gene_type:complete